MNIEQFNEMLLESARVGLAIANLDDLTLLFHNPRFAEWFPAAEDEGVSVPDLIDGIDEERMRKRIDRGRPYTRETEARLGRRDVSIAITFSRSEDEAGSFLILECQNVSKLKELEYMIESYSKMIERQNRKLQRENERAEKLLLNIMPKKVYEEIQEFGVTTPERFENASILMLDFVGFTEMAAVAGSRDGHHRAERHLYRVRSASWSSSGCERIKTIGDAYMAVSGMPESNAGPRPQHREGGTPAPALRASVAYVTGHGAAGSAASGLSHGARDRVDRRNPQVRLRHLRPGREPRGPARGTLSEAMQITLSSDMYELIRSDFKFDDLGEQEIKGLGTKHLYSLAGEGKHFRIRSRPR